jgi:hypothetical protein
MDIGIVRLMATVAISDDVKKHPLLTKQPHLISVKFNNTVRANSIFYMVLTLRMKGINLTQETSDVGPQTFDTE